VSILPTTKQVGEWVSVAKVGELNSVEAVAALFEHVALMAAIHSAVACQAACYEVLKRDGWLADPESEIQKLLNEARKA